MSYPPFSSDKGVGGASGFEALGGVGEGIGRFESIGDKDPLNIEHEDCFRGAALAWAGDGYARLLVVVGVRNLDRISMVNYVQGRICSWLSTLH